MRFWKAFFIRKTILSANILSSFASYALAREIATARGGRWEAQTVANVLKRVAA